MEQGGQKGPVKGGKPGVFLFQGNNGGKARRRPPFFRTKKLAIIGSTASIQFAPWMDPAWTIAAHPCSRPDCVREPDWYFDLHRPECFTTQQKRWNSRYYAWLQNLQTPIFMQEDASSCPRVRDTYTETVDGVETQKTRLIPSPWASIPMAVRYPLERVLAEYRGYFTNHVAYMIALAMTEGVTHIGLFGCQYSHETEHGIQRGSCEYWMGRFEQYGGTLVLPPRFCNLLAVPSKLYGYESHDERGKLIEEYRPKVKVPTITRPTVDGKGTEHIALTPIRSDSAEGRPPLMALPDGEQPAWERSGLAVDDAGHVIAPEPVGAHG